MSDPTPSDLMERRKAAAYLEAYASGSAPVLAWHLRALAKDILDGAHLTGTVQLRVAPYEVVEAEERAKHPRWHSGVWRTARDIADEFPHIDDPEPAVPPDPAALEQHWEAVKGKFNRPESPPLPWHPDPPPFVRERQGGLRGEEPIPWYATLTFEEVHERLLYDRTPGKAVEVPPGYMDWLAGQKPQGPVVERPQTIAVQLSNAAQFAPGEAGLRGPELVTRIMNAREINGVLEELVAAKAENARLRGILQAIGAARSVTLPDERASDLLRDLDHLLKQVGG